MRVGARKSSRITTIITLCIGGAIIIGVTLFIMYLNRTASTDTEVVISEESFVVGGMYGGTFLISDVSSVELKDTLPKINRRSNGAAIGEFKKGDFEIEGLGLSRLYLLSEEGPYLYVKVNDFYVIFNYADRARTEALYQALTDKMNK